jgi:cytochrome c oxidase assembly protein subunit 15
MTQAWSLVDLTPLLRLLLGIGILAAAVLAWLAWRKRGQGPQAWLAALSALTLFLTFDLIVFGAFTRLTDSGLGCPDWPGCYGAASPWGAHAQIADAQAAMPTGPVTFTKAWIEMIHRYLAMTVGALILVMAVASWRRRAALPHSPWLPTATLVWVLLQGLFGKFTVTLKLYPAVVTLHLLGGLVLLALLVMQYLRWRPLVVQTTRPLRAWLLAATAALWMQIALGGWVSTNYAVLACRGFPQCNGQWWPSPMNWSQAFEVLRPLGMRADGSLLAFDALVAIHMTHRLFALLLTALLLALAWRLWASQGAAARRAAVALLVVLVTQVGSGLSNVVLGWPLLAALAHSAGAAALVALTTGLWVSLRVQQPAVVHQPSRSNHKPLPRMQANG